MITMAVTGLKPGSGAKISLPTTDSAVSTAITTSSRAPVFPLSKPIKNGTHAKKAIIKEIMLYFLSSNSFTPIKIAAGMAIR